MMMFLLILWLYVLPAIISYVGIRYQFKYEWKGLEPDLGAFAMVFVPLLNWGYAIFTLMNITFSELEKVLDKSDESKLNKEILNKKLGSRFFRLK